MTMVLSWNCGSEATYWRLKCLLKASKDFISIIPFGVLNYVPGELKADS